MIRTQSAWAYVRTVTAPAVALAPSNYLCEIAGRLDEVGVRYAVANRDSGPIVDWLLSLLSLQGISDAVAFAFDASNGGITAADLHAAFTEPPSCSRLRSFWHFDRCGYRKGRQTCAEPSHYASCPLPRFPLRKGGLNVGAVGLHLFVRDICDGDLVGWIDAQLAAADPGVGGRRRAELMAASLVEPLSGIPFSGPKLWSLLLAELLLGSDPDRERWVSTGASLIAVDTLVHNYLHRTGTLRRLGCEHVYGPSCYAPDGCADVVAELARRTDARAFNPAFPRTFPRFVQHALWQYCSMGVRNICNGTQINDRDRCRQTTCPTFNLCDRIALGT